MCIRDSSESAVKSFVRDYVHGSVIRDAEWYRHLKTRLAGKYNMAYFARTAEVLPFYTSLTQGSWQQFLTRRQKELSVFSTSVSYTHLQRFENVRRFQFPFL